MDPRLARARQRLAGKRGRELWRSLEELAETPEFRELLERELPRHAAEWPAGVSRRRFLQLASASLALGGLTACTRQPLESIVPYVEPPEGIIPGRPLYFATATSFGGYATPLLAESHMGRPTKLEGNGEHPAGTGATDLFAQASVLTLYDPDRSQVVRNKGRIRSWEAFIREFRSAVAARQALGAERLRILTGTVTSPTVVALIHEILEKLPAARWHQWEPVHADAERRGAELAFGAPVAVRYDLGRTDVLLALDSDLLTSGPGSLVYARDFAGRRRLRPGGPEPNRLYAAESSPTATGTLADHRLALRPSEVGTLALALAAAIGVPEARTPSLPPELERWVAAAAADLVAHRGAGAVVAGPWAEPAVHALAHAMNATLGNVGRTVLYSEPVAAEPVDETDSLRRLVRDMKAGEVDSLLILGQNPVYDAPADLGFIEAMFQVPRRVHLGLYEDETAELCQWHLPQAHDLESWGDGRSFDGTVSLTQPLIEPLYGGRTIAEVLALVAREDEPDGKTLLEEHWRRRLSVPDFEAFWRRCLHDGFLPDTAAPARSVELWPAGIRQAAAALAEPATAESIEVAFRPDPTIWDGTFANNGWLQECPKPLTKLTWDNAALVSPALAERLGLANQEIVRLGLEGRSVEAPVWILPGHPDGTVTLHLGYGRRRTGAVGAGTGFNAYLLRTADAPWSARGLAIRPTGRQQQLASTQLHSNMALESREAAARHLVRVADLEAYRRQPDFARRQGKAPPVELNIFPTVSYDGHAWGLAVDLNLCTGCNACVVACQAENNIPIVGKEQVLLGREMHWIRIDRYFEGDLDAPRVHHQPVMCMQCEQAPCEVVCPVAATVHSDEGLNDMVYNRCVGTRYCSNNCPYKVRRFNFLKYNDTDTPVLDLLRNPDVTVRSRGVMEKCTYCVQRISAARIDAKRERRQIADGDIRTACQQACPAGAIVFGDLNDAGSEVAAWKATPRNYTILEELNTRPRTSYLAKVTNPNPELELDRS